MPIVDFAGMNSPIEQLVWIRLPNGKIKGSFSIDRVRIALRNGQVPTGCEIGVSNTGPWIPLKATNKPVQSTDHMPPLHAQWYFVKAGKKNGPVSEPQLVELAQSGIIVSTDLVWARGMTSWVSAVEADCLASIFRAREADSPPIPIHPASMAPQATIAAQPAQSKWNWTVISAVCILIGVVLKLMAGQLRSESTPVSTAGEQVREPVDTSDLSSVLAAQPPAMRDAFEEHLRKQFMQNAQEVLQNQEKASRSRIGWHNRFRGIE